jgi:hypothetical protein
LVVLVAGLLEAMTAMRPEVSPLSLREAGSSERQPQSQRVPCLNAKLKRAPAALTFGTLCSKRRCV